tara:strand:- start:547 stop:1122 length:576 start_codon:yes stop_codon:yes gene_type:complete
MKLLTTKEVCTLLRIHSNTLRNWRHKDKFPQPKKALTDKGKNLWLLSDIQEWISNDLHPKLDKQGYRVAYPDFISEFHECPLCVEGTHDTANMTVGDRYMYHAADSGAFGMWNAPTLQVYLNALLMKQMSDNEAKKVKQEHELIKNMTDDEIRNSVHQDVSMSCLTHSARDIVVQIRIQRKNRLNLLENKQ